MKRRMDLDYLRIIGLFLIILAHVGPPRVIFQLRNFDVPFMVILSGYLFSLNDNIKIENLKSYIVKRFIRLVIPTYIFLTFYFTLLYFVKGNLSLESLVMSYSLMGGIGYVWIIRIYFIISILSIFLIKYVENKKNKFLLISVLYIAYECSYYMLLNIHLNKYLKFLFDSFYINIGYIFPFYFGYFYKKLNIKKSYIILATTILFIFSVYFYFGKNEILNFQNYKYPPRLFYLLYTFIMSSCLLKFFLNKKMKQNKFISFIGSSTLWIYLYHIFIVKFLEGKDMNYIMKYTIVVTLSLIIVYIHQKIIEKIIQSFNFNEKTKKNLRIIFCY